MLCPKCKVELTMADRQGIEIDYCPNCRGVWLDRGELDKIIDRSMGMAVGQPSQGEYAQPPVNPNATFNNPGYVQPGYGTPPPSAYAQPGYRRDYDDDDDDEDYRYRNAGYAQPGYYPDGRRRRKEGFLGNLFDFD